MSESRFDCQDCGKEFRASEMSTIEKTRSSHSVYEHVCLGCKQERYGQWTTVLNKPSKV